MKKVSKVLSSILITAIAITSASATVNINSDKSISLITGKSVEQIKKETNIIKELENNVKKIYQKNFHVDVDLIKAKKIEGTQDYIIEVAIKKGGKVIQYSNAILLDNKKILIPITNYTIIVTDKGMLMTPNVIDVIRDRIQNQKMLEIKRNKEISKKVKKIIEKRDIVTYIDNKKPKTILVFLDPNCPHCINFIKDLDKISEQVNVAIVLAPLSRHENAKYYSANIVHKIKEAKTNKEKIDVLKKYFKDGNIKPKKEYNEDDMKEVKRVYDKYIGQKVIPGTPFIVELNEDDKKKLGL